MTKQQAWEDCNWISFTVPAGSHDGQTDVSLRSSTSRPAGGAGFHKPQTLCTETKLKEEETSIWFQTQVLEEQTNKRSDINETNYPFSGEIRRLGRGRPSMHRQERPLKTQREPTVRERNGGELLMFSVPCFIHRRLSSGSGSSATVWGFLLL